MKQQRIFEVYIDEIPINNNTNCQIVDLELFIVSFKEYWYSNQYIKYITWFLCFNQRAKIRRTNLDL